MSITFYMNMVIIQYHSIIIWHHHCTKLQESFLVRVLWKYVLMHVNVFKTGQDWSLWCFIQHCIWFGRVCFHLSMTISSALKAKHVCLLKMLMLMASMDLVKQSQCMCSQSVLFTNWANMNYQLRSCWEDDYKSLGTKAAAGSEMSPEPSRIGRAN